MARDLFGKSGADLLPFFLDPEAIGTAKTQLGGLIGVVNQNSDGFGAMADALESLDLKVQQFYAGMAQGMNGDIKGFANSLNEIDFTKFGEVIGQGVRALLEISKVLVELKPILIALAAQWAFNRIGALSLWGALGGGLAKLDMLKMQMTVLAAIMSKPGMAFKAGSMLFAQGARAMIAALGPVTTALLVAQGSFSLGKWLGKKITGNASGAQQEIKDIQGERGGLLGDFGSRVRNLRSEGDRSSLIGDLDKPKFCDRPDETE